MLETSPSYPTYNQTPNYASDLFSNPRTYDLMQQAVAEDLTQRAQEEPAVEAQPRPDVQTLTTAEHTADLSNLGRRIQALRSRGTYNN